MNMYDLKEISYAGKPLFQTAKMLSPSSQSAVFEEVACFFYVLKGRGELVESHGSHSISKEEGLVKSCGNFISNYFKDSEGNDFEAIVIYFYPDTIKELYSELEPIVATHSSKSSPPTKMVGNNLIEQFVEGLQIYFENEDLMDEYLAKLKIKELILILLRSSYFGNVLDLFNALFSPSQKSFTQVIENNLFSNITIEQLAFLTHRSLSTFKRDFKKAFNNTPAKYINVSFG
jgi:hypothetical protein